LSRFALIKAVLGPVMRLMFRPRVEGAEHIPGDGPVILAGNHLTFIDSMILPLV
jgi:1-acyl-sn-glycerol-3-phosphate acyltransferase